MLTYFDCCSFV